MRNSSTRSRVSGAQLGLAVILLLGLLLLTYGYFQPNKIGFYAGLIVIVAGVLNGVVQIVRRGGR